MASSSGFSRPERQNVKVIIDDGSARSGLLSKEREARVLELIEKHRNELSIPRQCVRLVKAKEPAQRTAHSRM